MEPTVARNDLMIDLHCHSTASDGTQPPEAVVAYAAAKQLSAIALTDHDTVAGLAAAFSAGERLGVRVIGGCEFSVAAPWGELHLLGYFLRPDSPRLLEFLDAARAMRYDRALAMVNALHGAGIRITMADVTHEAAGATLGRPHVARALLRLGHVPTLQTGFDRWLGPGRPAYVAKQLPTLADVASLVHRDGGVVSAAHLRREGTRDHLAQLQRDGLDAVEVRHPRHDGERIAILTEAASALGLARTGGSDWHGDAAGGGHADLGSQRVPLEWLTALEARRPAAA